MELMEILDRPAIGGNMPGKAPRFAKDIHKQSFTPAARLAVRAVVRPHNHLDIRFFHTGFKCREIGFIHILFCCLRVETVADSLRT